MGLGSEDKHASNSLRNVTEEPVGTRGVEKGGSNPRLTIGPEGYQGLAQVVWVKFREQDGASRQLCRFQQVQACGNYLVSLMNTGQNA